MTTLIICAMQSELAILKEKLDLQATDGVGPWALWRSHDGHLLAVVSGICKVNAAAGLSAVLARHSVDQIIGIGVAGGIAEDLHIGDTIICAEAIQHDIDLHHPNHVRGTVPGLNVRIFRAGEELVTTALESSEHCPVDSIVRRGRVLSGEQFIVGEEGRCLRSLLQGDCVDMETAAWAQVAHLYQIPWVAIRSISDKADEHASVDFPTFVQLAIERLSELILQMIANPTQDSGVADS